MRKSTLARLSSELIGRAALAMLLLACSEKKASEASRADSGLPIIADTATFVGPVCPVTGHWTRCMVLYRLERAGLTVHAESLTTVTEMRLTVGGQKLPIARGDLSLFVYADSGSRSRDEAKLDKTMFITASQQPTLLRQRTLIHNDNLLVLMNVAGEANRERISDALMAGLPPLKKTAPAP